MAFPTTVLDLTFEVALGADLTADPSTWVWTDATDYVLARDGVVITRGGYDGSVQSPPSTCRLTLDNTDGRWVATNPTGAWYGQLSKGIPIRILTGEGSTSVRWTGFLVELPPRWDPSENNRYVPVTAAGIMRRLQRGQTPLRSPLVRAIAKATTTPVAYWPGEDGTDASSIAEYFGGPAMDITGQVVTLASDGPVGSLPLPEFTTVGGATGTIPTYVPSGSWTIAFVLNFPATPSAETVLLQWRTTGDYPVWQLTLTPGSPDVLTLEALDGVGVQQITHTLNYAIGTISEPFGQWTILQVNVVADGADLDYRFGIYNADGGNGSSTATATGVAAGAVSSIRVHANAKFNGAIEGHWAVWNADVDVVLDTQMLSALNAFTGDTVISRAGGLGDEEGLGVEWDTGSPIAMGAQGIAPFIDLLREAEAVSGGRLFENRDPTQFNAHLHLLHSGDLENQTAALTLSHNTGHLALPFEPTDDDTYLRNDWTATRQTVSGTGSSARVVATEGEHSSSLTPENVGTYDDSVTVNVELDTHLAHQAGWRVNIGTHEGLRFPVVSLNFARNPSLIADWITCDIGSRITITNPPAGMAPDDIDLIIEGWTETFGPYTWQVQLNCSPYAPWHVIQLAETSGDTDPFLGRLAGDPECALRIAIDSDDLSAVIDPNFYRWTVEADDFPLDVELGGEVVTVSGNANGAAIFIAAGAASHADNAAVAPAIYAGASVRQVIFVLAAIRSSGTGTLTTPTDYTRLPVFAVTDNVQLYAKVHDGSESAPTITPSGGAAGDTVSAITFGFTNMSNTLDDLGDIVVESVAQLNASAQNVAYGGVYAQLLGTIQLIVAWKQDDYTSIAVPAGFTEIAEASSTTGNDQSLYAAYRIDTTQTVVNEGALVVTGGASAISRSAVLSVASGVQTLTISARSVNGVTKAHAVGTRVAVHDPAVLAL